MQKPAPTDHPIHPLLRERWSPCAFSSEPVEPSVLQSCFEAARWAASCFNEQPWRFLVALSSEPDEHRRMVECLVPANREWAAAAPVLGLSVARLAFTRNEKPNRHAYFDAGAAMAQLTLQATAHGLRVHQMGGFDQERAREAYAIPDGWDPVAAFALGAPGDPGRLPERLRARDEAPRARKPLPEIAFGRRFGEPLGLG